MKYLYIAGTILFTVYEQMILKLFINNPIKYCANLWRNIVPAEGVNGRNAAQPLNSFFNIAP